MKTKMKKYEDGGSTRKARLEGRAAKKMGKAQRTYKEAEATLSEAKSSGNPMDYADADQLYSRSARQGERAKKLKAKAAMMKKGGAMKPLRKAQNGKVVRTKDQNVSAIMYPSINPASNSLYKSNKNSTIDDQNELSIRASGSTATKKGPFGRTVQKTTITDATQPRDMYAPSGKAYGTRTTEKDVFNKKGQLIKSVSKERDINTGELKSVNKAKFDKTWTGKKGGAVKKMKTGGMVNANSKVSALKVAGSKGVKSGVNPKAAASKVAKGRSGGTSAAPKTAVPKAKYGMGITKMKKK